MGLSLHFAPLFCLQGVSLSSGMLGVDAAVVLPLLVVATLHHGCLGSRSSAVPPGGPMCESYGRPSWQVPLPCTLPDVGGPFLLV